MKQSIKVGSTLVHIEYSSMSEQDANEQLKRLEDSGESFIKI